MDVTATYRRRSNFRPSINSGFVMYLDTTQLLAIAEDRPSAFASSKYPLNVFGSVVTKMPLP